MSQRAMSIALSAALRTAPLKCVSRVDRLEMVLDQARIAPDVILREIVDRLVDDPRWLGHSPPSPVPTRPASVWTRTIRQRSTR